MRTSPRRRPTRSVAGALTSCWVAVATALLVAVPGPVALGASAEALVVLRVTGTIEHVVSDAAFGAVPATGAPDIFVQVDGKLYVLPAGTVVPPGPTGLDVVITLEAAPGVGAGQALELAAAEVAHPEARVVEVRSVPGAPAADALGTQVPAVVTGGHTLTILPVDWTTPDVPIGTLATLATATAAYWNVQSASRLSMTASVRPWQTIPDPGACDAAGVTTMFNAALAVNPDVAAPSLTHHVLVYFPRVPDCASGRMGWAGLATVLAGQIWINGYPLVSATAHEFGHNLGLDHANLASCTSGGVRVSLSASCSSLEYGDDADVMGGPAWSGPAGNLNAASADYLGFATVTTISAAPSPVIVDLAPLGRVSALRAVRIPAPTGDVYVEFRPFVAPDLRRPEWAGVQVHLRMPAMADGSARRTYLLDMQLAAPAWFTSPQLPVGASWDVPDTGLTVSVLSVGATARIQVAKTVTLDQYVTRVYSDLFGRTPDPQGLATWTAALRAGTPRVAVANSITYSTEYRSGLINGSYTAFLGRPAESSGRGFWLGQMSAGMTIQQMEASFLSSQEFYDQSGGSAALWVQRLYGDVLGRTAAPSEVAYWVSVIGGPNGRYWASMGFLLSTERLTTVVDAQYVHLLGRSVDPGGRQTWVGQIQSGVRLEAVIGSLVASAEYWGRI